MFVPSLSWPNDHFKYEMAQKDVFPYRHRFLRRTSWSHRRRLRGEGVGERAHQPVRFRTVSEVFNVWSSLEPIECVSHGKARSALNLCVNLSIKPQSRKKFSPFSWPRVRGRNKDGPKRAHAYQGPAPATSPPMQ
jgi:hypothetical protein